MDRLAAMQIFVRVAELGSFSAAAAQLDLDRSVVTRQIAALEAHLGIKLMERSTRRLSLSAAGATYLEKCRLILNLVEVAESDLAEEGTQLRGRLRLSLPLSFGLKRLAPLLLRFASLHPDLALDMDYSDRRANLIEEGLDLSIRVSPGLADTEVARKIGRAQLWVVASPDYLARHGRPRTPAELAHHQCLAYTANGQAAWPPFRVNDTLEQVPLRSRISANNGDVLIEAAARGLGITFQPDFICEDYVAQGRVEVLLRDFPLPELGVFALLPSNRHVPLKVRAMIDFLKQGLAVGESDY
ncbi:MAG: LysR family transcriptional regulator [Uliginosibacterium sp.]|nr:LysR family transcriptional regulator [Uliginosibacterium sp.]